MDNPTVTIIIISFNTKHYLDKCLASIRNHPPSVPFEIIVVDNNSTDGSYEMVAQRYPEIQLIRNRVNEGFAAANNKAIKSSRGSIFFLLNSDTEILPETFTPMLNRLAESQQTGIVGPTEQFASGTCYPTICPFPNLWFLLLSHTRFRQKYYFNRWINPYRRIWEKAQANHEPVEVDWMSGASLMIRRRVVDEIGMFDERYFFYMEETDLCKRASDAGWKIEFIPEGRIMHHAGGSAEEAKPGLLTLSGALGELRYFKKHQRCVEILGLKTLMLFEYVLKSFLVGAKDPRRWAYREVIRALLGFRQAVVVEADLGRK